MKCYLKLFGHAGRQGIAQQRSLHSNWFMDKKQSCRWKLTFKHVELLNEDTLSVEEYVGSMMDRIDELPKGPFRALEEIEREKLWVAKVYNRWVREKSFQGRDLV
jgi:hypothetical protein